MLVLSRKVNESIVIAGRITVRVIRVDGEVVKLGIEAPADVVVHRFEVYEEIQRSNREALVSDKTRVPKLPRRTSGVPGTSKLTLPTTKPVFGGGAAGQPPEAMGTPEKKEQVTGITPANNRNK